MTRWAERLLVALLPTRLRADLVGDLREEAATFVEPERGAAAARRFLIEHLLRAVRDVRSAQLARSLRRLRSSPPGGSMLSSLRPDVRFALRSLRRAPAFSIAVIAMFALGLTVTVATSALVEAMLIRNLPYESAEQLVDVWSGGRVSGASFQRLEAEMTSLDSLAAYAGYDLTLLEAGDPVVLDGERVTPAYLQTLGAAPRLGRDLNAADSEPGAEPVVLLAEQVWRERFAADPNIIGRAIRLDGGGTESRTVIGIVGSDFRPLAGADRRFWVPLPLDPSDDGYYGSFLRMVGRLVPDASAETATAELQIAADRLHADGVVRDSVDGVQVVALHDVVTTSTATPLVFAWLAAFGLYLLACANTVNLLLTRWRLRTREVSVRCALGARRGSVVRQLLLEATTLALGGLVFAVPAVVVLLPNLTVALDLPDGIRAMSGLELFGYGLLFALGTGLLCGLGPALRTVRPGYRGREGRPIQAVVGSGRGWRNALIVAQVSIALVLVAGAGLAVKSVWRLAQQETGFAPEGVVLMQLSPLDTRYRDRDSRAAFYDEVLARIARLPAVVAAGASHLRPMTLETWTVPYFVAGTEPDEGDDPSFVSFRIITADYHEAVGEQLLAGRALGDADRDDTSTVTLVNESFAKLYWSDAAAAVGATFNLYSAEGPPIQIVGVVADVRQHELATHAEPALYLPFRQNPQVGMHLAVRVLGEPLAPVGLIREQIWEVDPTVPITAITTFDEALRTTLGARYALGNLLGTIAILALVLGAAGVYSVLSFLVQHRRREIAVRMAVGADPARVRRALSIGMMRLVMLGVALGTGLATAAWRGLESQLFETSATDPAILTTAAAALAAAGAMASYGPIRRATRIDPAELLRTE